MVGSLRCFAVGPVQVSRFWEGSLVGQWHFAISPTQAGLKFRLAESSRSEDFWYLSKV